ncbi:hypothetical protein TrVE_jg8762 [Triparma verrucosa]|uniref:Uncharacterized protein n=2 Tax=Triparma TaxID=722752 RepID=A0A9W7B3C2_9STRA|nr:hypothetical protein TrVE_jg8762 [Triparma verrucosa]GMH83112.1 hypothetical protein TrST_g8030 [Triparma strigata]
MTTGRGSTMAAEMNRPKEFPGQIRVTNENLWISLFGGEEEEGQASPQSRSQRQVRGGYLKKKHAKEAQEKIVEEGMIRTKRFMQHKENADRQMNENSRKVKEKVAEIARKKEDNYRSLRKDLLQGNDLASDVGRYLLNHHTAQRAKVKKQYDTWNEEIYGTIATKIHTELDSRSYKHMHQEKLKHYDKFLAVTNAKGSVFRDIIIESEYDPLIPNRNSVKVQTEVLKDPIKRSVQRTLEEKGLSKDVIRPRETLNVLEWATGKIEATPHGFFAKMMSENRKPANATKSKTMESRVANCLDQYNIARGRAELDKEFPQGKKTKHTQKKEKLVLS